VNVTERLEVLRERVRVAVAARRHADPGPDPAFRGLYVTDEQADRLLRGAGSSAAGPADTPGDGALADRFGLTRLDLDILAAAVAPDLDPRYERLYGYLHDDLTRRRASIGLALELAGASPLDQAARHRFDPDAPLVGGGLLVVGEPDRPFLSRPLRVPDRVTAHLLGGGTLTAGLRSAIREPLPVRAPEADQLVRAWAGGVRVVHCQQPPGEWCPALVRYAAALAGRSSLTVDLTGQQPTAVPQLLALALREAQLLDRVLVVGPVELADTSALRGLTTAAARGAGWSVVLYGTAPWDPAWSDDGVLGLDLRDLARRPPDRPPLGGAAGAAALAGFRLGPHQLARAVAAATAHAMADGGTLTATHLRAGARMQNTTGLGRLARRVRPAAGWDDLVLPRPAVDGLRHLTDRVRWRDRVLGDWGLRRGGSRGEGTSALFVGEPGTGKTMAAEVVAATLGLDLYVIDLSTVVDKYVGETEKNLERIFAGAEGVNGVLFFDEADALFGKRSEVSDARDRYANLEVAYLLQRMESFDGLAVLATNLRSNLDDAFARRISTIVEFPRPEQPQRRLLWVRSLASVPLADDVDLDFCAAAFDVAGGDIRNMAVTAAYLAAAEGGTVDMRRIVRAVHLEYRKLGRLCVEAEFGPYFPLLTTA
jgi:hypothetical protein